MKKGMILYVTQGEEDVPPQAAAEMVEAARSLGVTTVCVAITEADAVHGWWRLMAKGMQEVFFMTAAYNAVLGKFESKRAPALLGGFPFMN